MTRGFITIAAGEYYCQLAEHLYMSYRLFSGCDYPFFVITDAQGEKRLSKTFDGVIVKNDFTQTSVDKICFFTEAPFDQNIFIDADCSVVNDLNYVFDAFEKNGSDISAISLHKTLKKGENGVQFTAATAEMLDISEDFPRFNGGVYWYRKSPAADQAIRFMTEELLPNYHRYQLLGRSNSTNMGDEPLVIVTMLKSGLKTLPSETNIMFLLFDKNDKVRWDMKKRICYYPWADMIVSPSIIHWKLGGTETLQYERYDAEVRGRYAGDSRLRISKQKTKSFIKYKIYAGLVKVFPAMSRIAKRMK